MADATNRIEALEAEITALQAKRAKGQQPITDQPTTASKTSPLSWWK